MIDLVDQTNHKEITCITEFSVLLIYRQAC